MSSADMSVSAAVRHLWSRIRPAFLASLIFVLISELDGSAHSAVFGNQSSAEERTLIVPGLPRTNSPVDLPGQEWPLRPGPRNFRVLIHYPGGALQNVNADTGIMLTLHNWGGQNCDGTASPEVLAESLNVIAVCVNYLQSGRQDAIDSKEAYDFGHLQAIDALRALWYVRQGLKAEQIAYDDTRIYCTGGSGGGNVTLMACKFAPRTFACVIDLCGMKKLSDDIAFDLPGGSTLNARWSRDPASPNYLSMDQQEIRFIGHPVHLQEMKSLSPTARILIVHGTEDDVCPWADAEDLIRRMQEIGIDVEPHPVTPDRVDGKVFSSAGHSLGDRTQIVLQTAGHYLKPDSPRLLRRNGDTDFDRRETIRYTTRNGQFLIDYSDGSPVSRFEPAAQTPDYQDHHSLNYVLSTSGQSSEIRTTDDWNLRRQHIVRHFEKVTGPLPSEVSRVPLKIEVAEESVLVPAEVQRVITRLKITYQSDENDRVPAWVFIPAVSASENVSTESSAKPSPSGRLPAVLCLQQTTEFGKDEPAGVRGDPTMKYALELAEMGFVTIAPDYPSFGEHAYDFAAKRGYVSGTMKAVWDNIRAIDVLETMPEVDPERIGCIGHSLGGHSAIFTAVFEPRLRAVVTSCGFTSLQKDDVPSWTGKRYMPLISSQYLNDPAKLPFDFHELIGCVAPRPLLISAATGDEDFDVEGVRDVVKSASFVWQLHNAPDAIHAVYPKAPHSFPDDIRREAGLFLIRSTEVIEKR